MNQRVNLFVRRIDNGAERLIWPYFGTTYVFYARPDLTYRLTYTGNPSMCFKVHIRDGQAGEVYRFVLVRSSSLPFTGAGSDIPIASSLNELANPTPQMIQYYDASTNSIFLSAKMTQFYAMNSPNGQSLQVGESPERTICT